MLLKNKVDKRCLAVRFQTYRDLDKKFFTLFNSNTERYFMDLDTEIHLTSFGKLKIYRNDFGKAARLYEIFFY